jgi:hypothetical protein
MYRTQLSLPGFLAVNYSRKNVVVNQFIFLKETKPELKRKNRQISSIQARQNPTGNFEKTI